MFVPNFLNYSMKKLLIYKASAGSGKTHMLTQEYLKLAFQNTEKYKNILAVTFTNKAADEMKERILHELNTLYEKGYESGHYSAIATTFPHYDELQIKQMAFQIRSNILHNYSLFSVSTIDSFVQKVVRSFSYEIGVHSGYKVEIETDKVLSDITEIIYKQVGNDANLLDWLIKFAEYKIEEGKNWDFRGEVYDLGREIFKERFQIFSQEIAQKEDINALLKTFYLELLEIRNSFKKKMKEIGLKADKIIQNAGIKSDALGQKFKTISNYLCKKIVKPLTNADYEAGKTVLAALDGIDNWYAKTAKNDVKHQIESVQPRLLECVQLAVNEYDINFESYLNAVVTLSNYHAFGLLNEIAKRLPEYRDENNLLLISDTTLLLKEIIGENDAPFIYEKIGNRYQNILIDEFQDTSGFQWENFKPLILNSIAEGLQNLIVGDVKQSIYRWRGGDWKLLLQTAEENVGSQNVENKTLDVNWRSRKNILDFNNALFKIAPKLANIEFSGASSEEGLIDAKKYGDVLEQAYSDSFQQLPKEIEKKGGRVNIKFYKVEKQADMSKFWRGLMQNDLAETIDNLLKNKNYTPTDIAILVRKNSEAKEVTNQLINYLSQTPTAFQYDIISEESLSVAKSLSIRIIISMLHCLFDEKRDIYLASLNLELERLKNSNFQAYSTVFGFNHSEAHKTELLFEIANLKQKVVQLSLFEQVENVINLFKLNEFPLEFPYIRSFQDIVLNFTRNQSSDLSNFLDWWENEKHKFNIQISDKQDAVKVLTIHKSKGLAFNVVLVPFVDWKLENASYLIAPILWAKTHDKLYEEFSYLPIKYQKSLAQTQFKQDYFEEKLFQYMDSLNALYVAFTRPYQELLLFMPTLGTADKVSSVADLVYASVVLKNEHQIIDNKEFICLNNSFDSEKLEFTLDKNYKYIDDAPFKKPEEKLSILLTNYASSDWAEKLAIKTNADNYFVEKDEYRQQKINYGTLMHEILSRIQTPSDIESALQEAYFAGKISIPERKYILLKLNEIIGNEQIKHWFSDEYEIKTEAEILTVSGEKKIPDRLLISESELVVIDFKFGTFREEHLHQVQEYKGLLSLVNELKTKKISGYLYYAETAELIEV